MNGRVPVDTCIRDPNRHFVLPLVQSVHELLRPSLCIIQHKTQRRTASDGDDLVFPLGGEQRRTTQSELVRPKVRNGGNTRELAEIRPENETHAGAPNRGWQISAGKPKS